MEKSKTIEKAVTEALKNIQREISKDYTKVFGECCLYKELLRRTNG